MEWSEANAILSGGTPVSPAARALAQRMAEHRRAAIGQELIRRYHRRVDDLLAIVGEWSPDPPPGKPTARLRVFGLVQEIVRIEREHGFEPSDGRDWPLAIREQVEALEDGTLTEARFAEWQGGLPVKPAGAP
jgi:hypothetical protein